MHISRVEAEEFNSTNVKTNPENVLEEYSSTVIENMNKTIDHNDDKIDEDVKGEKGMTGCEDGIDLDSSKFPSIAQCNKNIDTENENEKNHIICTDEVRSQIYCFFLILIL